MKWYRSVVSLVIVAIAVLTVSCGSGSKVVKAPTYSSEQLSQIAIYAGRITASQKRLPELVDYLEKEDWTNVDNFIHGPLGELRVRMERLSNLLLPEDKKQAKPLADEVGVHLEGISLAGQEYNYDRAVREYNNFESDLADLLDIVPEGARPADSVTTENVYEMVTPSMEDKDKVEAVEDAVEGTEVSEPEDLVSQSALTE